MIHHHNDKVEHHSHQGGAPFSPEALAKLRRVLDIKEEDKIKEALLTYAEYVEIIHAYYPTWGTDRSNWALAMAISPDWYGDALKERLQNSMLVSALLLTITAAYFVEPPESLYPKDSTPFRAFVWICGMCNTFFILSIVFGIFYIENAMSRTYGQSERFYLIMKYFSMKNYSQILSAIGNALFPIVLALPMQQTFVDLDAYLLWVITALYLLLSILAQVITTMGAFKEQTSRHNRLLEITDPESSRLKPEYYPADAELTVRDLQDMYRRDSSEK